MDALWQWARWYDAPSPPPLLCLYWQFKPMGPCLTFFFPSYQGCCCFTISSRSPLSVSLSCPPPLPLPHPDIHLPSLSVFFSPLLGYLLLYFQAGYTDIQQSPSGSRRVTHCVGQTDATKKICHALINDFRPYRESALFALPHSTMAAHASANHQDFNSQGTPVSLVATQQTQTDTTFLWWVTSLLSWG